MIAWIFLYCVSVSLAAEPTHLKPGALVGHLGRVALVEDVLWVTYPYASLRVIPHHLRDAVGEIDSALARLQIHLNDTNTHVVEPLDLMHVFAARLAFMNDTLALALAS